MIIATLISLIVKVFSVLTAFIKVPGTPQAVKDFLATALEYMTAGMQILANYVDVPYLLLLFGLVITVDASIFTYRLIMWVLRKIPFFGIE